MAGKARAKTVAVTVETNKNVSNPAAEEPKKPKQEAEKKASFFVYLGPSILGVIQNAGIYKPEEVDTLLGDAIAKYPRIRQLLVSDATIVEDRINVTKPGTRLYVEYHRLVNELKK